MNSRRIDPAALSRMIAAGALGIFGLLALGPDFVFEASARAIALIALGLAIADLLVFAFDFGRGLWLGKAPGAAALEALREISRSGAIASLAFGAGWLLAHPAEPAGLASFAILETCALLLILAVRFDVRLAPGVPWHALGRQRQRVILLLACIPPVASLTAAGWFSVWKAPAREFVCPVLPNGAIPAAGIFDRACPFQPLDRVVEVWVPGSREPFAGIADLERKAAQWPDFVEWTAVREGRRISAQVPQVAVPMRARLGRITTAVLLAGALMATGLIIAWNTASAAAVPFLLFTALVCSGLISALCAGSSESLRLGSALANAGFAPVLAHLALRFPRDHVATARIRLLPGAYYAAGLGLMSLEGFAFRSSAELWILLERLVPIFPVIGWAGMLIGASSVLRSSQVPFERHRARVFVIGSASALALATALGEAFRTPTPFAYRTGIFAVVLLQIPIAVALVRYSVFDLHPRARRTIQAVAYSIAIAGILTLLALLLADGSHSGVPLKHAGLLFSVLASIFLISEALRGWISGPGWDLVSGSAKRRRTVVLQCAQQLAELRDPDACARILAGAIAEGTRAAWVSVFLRSPELGLRPAFAIGAGAVLSPELARESDASTSRRQVLHLSRSAAPGAQERLVAAGIDVLVPLHSAAGTAGLVLVGRREEGGPYTLEELEFLGALAAQGGTALDNARLARELIDAERNAARGNLAVGLAHELGKPLRVIEDLARSLSKGTHRERFGRDAQQISEISQELIRTVYGFVHAARRRGLRPGAAVADVVVRAVHSIEHLHGADRVSVQLAPDLPDVVGGAELATVLSNLLDNALLASAAGDSVQLFANCDERELRFEVVDDGHGMDDATAARAFELFFTRRAGRGGSGIGLALCREIVDQLGGTIELSSSPGKGTRVVVHLPRVAEADDPCPGSTPPLAPG